MSPLVALRFELSFSAWLEIDPRLRRQRHTLMTPVNTVLCLVDIL